MSIVFKSRKGNFTKRVLKALYKSPRVDKYPILNHERGFDMSRPEFMYMSGTWIKSTKPER